MERTLITCRVAAGAFREGHGRPWPVPGVRRCIVLAPGKSAGCGCVADFRDAERATGGQCVRDRGPAGRSFCGPWRYSDLQRSMASLSGDVRRECAERLFYQEMRSRYESLIRARE